jgi:hypothetical protein
LPIKQKSPPFSGGPCGWPGNQRAVLRCKSALLFGWLILSSYTATIAKIWTLAYPVNPNELSAFIAPTCFLLCNRRTKIIKAWNARRRRIKFLTDQCLAIFDCPISQFSQRHTSVLSNEQPTKAPAG